MSPAQQITPPELDAIHRLMADIDAAVKETGLKRSTVCQLAFRDARRYERLRRRVAKAGEDAKALQDWLNARRDSPNEKGAAA